MEATHILVGALEAPGDVLIHGAVIEVQALGWKRGGEPQGPDAWVPAPRPTSGRNPVRAPPTDTHLSPPSTHLIKIFIFIVILDICPEFHVLPPFLLGNWEPP